MNKKGKVFGVFSRKLWKEVAKLDGHPRNLVCITTRLSRKERRGKAGKKKGQGTDGRFRALRL